MNPSADFSLVGYVNQVGEPGRVLALFGRMITPNHYEYFAKHDAFPMTKLTINTKCALTDRQVIRLPGYKNPFYTNIYSEDTRHLSC